MEIKKYVLLKNNNIVEFYENNKYGFLYVEEEGGTIYIKDALTSHVKLTSDNILDLVEVGDLVEINEMIGIYYVDSIILEDDELKVFTCDQKYGYRFCFNETEVKAIYKRQINGDYKRYEVV